MKVPLRALGVCQSGHLIVKGVFSFYETFGLPLDIVLWALHDECNALPDWIDLVTSMHRAGRPLDRTFTTVETAINDAGYPPETRVGVLSGLEQLQSLLLSRNEQPNALL